MKKILIFVLMRYLILVFLSACSFMDEPHYEVNPELKPYVDSFFADAKKNGLTISPPNLIVRLEQIGDICGVSKGYELPIVSIDIDFFEGCKMENREDYIILAVYHELGHALLGLEHTKKLGIMGENMPFDEFGANKESMIKNMFLFGI